jgi:signal-transduction protein with cAMP-binding, CBS, and nucleotidyltransferase domain
MGRGYLGRWQKHQAFFLFSHKIHKALIYGGYREHEGGMMASKGWWGLVFIAQKS